MRTIFKTELFTIEYRESDVKSSLLWERHCHADFEMIGVLEGDVSVTIEGCPRRLTQNQAVIIPPLCYHTVIANQQGCYRRITVRFADASIPRALRGSFSSNSPISVFSPSRLEAMQSLVKALPSPLYAPLADAYIMETLYDELSARQSEAWQETDSFLQAAISYIDEHLYEKISVDTLARITSRSRSSFCHLFEKKMKIAPKQYVLQKKMALANQMINDGTSPTKAAGRLGYENYSSFYRMYVKLYGTSPKENKNATKNVERDLPQ